MFNATFDILIIFCHYWWKLYREIVEIDKNGICRSGTWKSKIVPMIFMAFGFLKETKRQNCQKHILG
jgi:hypothetical protein